MGSGALQARWRRLVLPTVLLALALLVSYSDAGGERYSMDRADDSGEVSFAAPMLLNTADDLVETGNGFRRSTTQQVHADGTAEEKNTVGVSGEGLVGESEGEWRGSGGGDVPETGAGSSETYRRMVAERGENGGEGNSSSSSEDSSEDSSDDYSGDYSEYYSEYYSDNHDDDDDDDDADAQLSFVDSGVHDRLGRFFVLSDIHLDLMYQADQPVERFCRNGTIAAMYNITESLEEACGSEDYPFDDSRNYDYGRFGCDPPPSLLAATLAAMAEVEPNPAFILLTGDYVGHCQLTWDNMIDAVENVTGMIELFFPDTLVLPILGNNEVHPHNQLPLGETGILSYYSDVFSSWLERMGPEEKGNYKAGAYFSASPVPGLRVIGLNSIYYGRKWCPGNFTECSKSERTAAQLTEGDDPVGQFAWYEQQLAAAEEAGERVLVSSHISPGRARGFKALWQDDYQETFLNISLAHHEVIEGMFYGHIHRDAYVMSVYNSDDDDDDDDDDGEENRLSMYVNSAMSPRSDNFPTFRLVEFDLNSLELVDYVQYTLDLIALMDSPDDQPPPLSFEEEYRFSTEYEVGSLSNVANLQLYHHLRNHNSQYNTWKHNWASNSPQVEYDNSKKEFLCSLKSPINAMYDACVG